MPVKISESANFPKVRLGNPENDPVEIHQDIEACNVSKSVAKAMASSLVLGSTPPRGLVLLQVLVVAADMVVAFYTQYHKLKTVQSLILLQKASNGIVGSEPLRWYKGLLLLVVAYLLLVLGMATDYI
jgi:hypothetical protein